MLVLALALVFAAAAPAGALAANGHAVPASVPRPATYIGPDRWDSVDGTWTTAPTLPMVSYHVFGTLPNNGLFTGDADWFKVKVARAGTPITIDIKRTSGQGGSLLDVFAANGTACQATSTALGGPADPNDGGHLLGSMTPGFWISGMAKLYFVAPSAGTYYFRHRPAADGTAEAGYPRDALANVVPGAGAYELHVVVGDADRLSGASRYLTALGVSHQMWNAADDPYWWEGPWGNGVILVSGENYADGLAAGALSVRTGNPVLLTPKNVLPASVADEIHRLASANWWNAWNSDGTRRDNTFTVYICGSDAAVSTAVETALDADQYVTSVRRLQGANRYGTAVAIADEADKRELRAPVGQFSNGVRPQRLAREAFVINGGAWADGLAAGPVAGWVHAPVLMTTRFSLPQETAEWLKANGVGSVHVVGGPSVVDTSVITAIESLSTSPTVDRIAGGTRYETAYKVATYGVSRGMVGNAVTVVSGDSPWDALSAGQLTFMTYSPLMLTQKTALSSWVTKFYDDNGGFQYPSFVVGGEPAVGAAAYTQLRDLWKRPVLR